MVIKSKAEFTDTKRTIKKCKTKVMNMKIPKRKRKYSRSYKYETDDNEL